MDYYACLVNYEELLLGFWRKNLKLVSLLFSIQRYLKTVYSIFVILVFLHTIFVHYIELCKYCTSKCYLFI